jgi:hypothetical protein
MPLSTMYMECQRGYQGKVWFGDLNITKEGKKLAVIVKNIGEPLYILRERDCRFSTENDPIDDIIQRAVWNTNNYYD